MRILGWALIIVLGALILCPAVSYLGFDPLPGDFHLQYGDSRIYVPFGTSLVASVALTLLFFIARR